MTQGPLSDPLPGTSTSISLDRYDAVTGIALALVALATYVRTLAPGLMESDCAELQTQAVMLGYAHPTGYPVYLLLAKLATWLPLGDVAYRVNLLSAILAAVATAELYILGRLLTGRRGPAVAGAVAMAVSPTFWSQAVMAKVYTTGIACMVAVLVCLELWRQRDRMAWLFAAGCLGGISLGIHITHSLMAPAVLVMLLLTPRRWKANWTVATAGAISGLLITLAAYAVIDFADSPTSYFRTVIYPSRSLWNLEPRDLDSFGTKVELCLRPPQYTVLLFSKSSDETLAKLRWYAGNLPYEFPWPWLVASAAGLVWLWRRHWRMTLLLVLTFAAHLGYDLIYDMGGIHVLHIATYVPIALLGMAGVAWAADLGHAVPWSYCCRWSVNRRVGRRAPMHGIGRRVPPETREDTDGGTRSARPTLQFADLVAGLLGLAIVLWPLAWPDAWNVEGRRDCQVPPDEDPFRVEYAPTFQEPMTEFHQRVRELVDSLEPHAVVFTGWCPLYAYYYVAYIERGRTDLVFFQDYPHPYYFELADSAVEYTAQTAPYRPVYFTHVVRKVADRFEMTPVRRGRDTLYRVGPRKNNSPASP